MTVEVNYGFEKLLVGQKAHLFVLLAKQTSFVLIIFLKEVTSMISDSFL